jgi:hypothetical protein
MPYSKEQYQTLQDAIASGTLSVKYSDKEVTYRSLDDMIRVLNLMRTELFPDKRPVRRKYALYDKGIEGNRDSDYYNYWGNERF